MSPERRERNIAQTKEMLRELPPMINASIILDSYNFGMRSRITTFLLTYPRFIHSELMTHRVFSRNAASSRAIPIRKMIEAVRRDPARPVEWGLNKPGMQAGEVLTPEQEKVAREVWLRAADSACGYAEQLASLGCHKQVANRVLEPFAHMTTLVTATEFENFFHLRSHPDAQPEFQYLADLMLHQYVTSTPVTRHAGDWHIPFAGDLSDLPLNDRIRVAVARCARTSYTNMGVATAVEEDIALHDKLVKSGHWSPFEHVAQASQNNGWSGNFYGWTQWRKVFPYENRSGDLFMLHARRPVRA